MSKNLVRYTIDLNNPPPLTKAQEAELDALAARPDSEIDTTDIPPLTEEFWRNAVRNPFLKPRKASASSRVRSCPAIKGYQTRMNAVLRREMLASIKEANSH